jgi:hypothetical protein
MSAEHAQQDDRQCPNTIARSSDFIPGVTQAPQEALLLADFVFELLSGPKA